MLYSYHPSFPTSSKIFQGIKEAFGEALPIIDIEYMDSKRLHDDTSRANFLRSLSHKLSQREAYDVVITADDNALDFMLAHGPTLFPGVPTVFLGVNDIPKALQQNRNPHVTGVVEAASVVETARLIQQLLPGRSQLNVITDGTTSGHADLQSLLQGYDAETGPPLRILSLAELTWSEYERQLNELGDEDMLLLLSAFRDRDGISKSFEHSLNDLLTSTSAPVFHTYEHGFGDGVVGGILVNHFEQGREAGRLAKEILSGTAAETLPVVAESPNVTMFDYRALQRFEIDTRLLPTNTRVAFEPPRLWTQYRFEINGILGLLLLLLLVSLHLARQNYVRARMARDLHEKSGLLRLLMDTLPDMVWMKDTEGQYLSCNRRFQAFLGAPEAQIVGRTDFDFIDLRQASRFRERDRHAVELRGPVTSEEPLVFASDGHSETLETIRTPVSSEDGEVIGVLGIARDISARRSAEDEIRKLSLVVEQSPVSVMITDREGNIEYVNRSCERVSGFRQAEILGSGARMLHSEETPQELFDEIWASLKAGKTWEGELRNRRKNGEHFWEYAHLAPVLDDEGEIQHYFAVKEDITLRKQQHEKILYQAHFDSLTQLPNRLLSLDRLRQLLFQARRDGSRLAVLFIDLDDFKKINDSLGHDSGDSLLVESAKRLQDRVRKQDTIGRLGGDEFIVLLGDIDNAQDAANVASDMISQIEKPFVIDHRELLISASVGIALYPDDGDEPKELLRRADAAMYHAKRNGRAAYAFFSEELNSTVSRHFAVEQELLGALARREFQILYQPQVDIRTRDIVGAEALIRWTSPILGNVSPNEFIPIAEQSGAITAIGRYVLQTAIRDTASLCTNDAAPFSLSVNLSPRQFRDDSLVELIESTLRMNAVKPNRLVLEITEGLFIDPNPQVDATLRRLNESGILLAMDDFGTGYSSLSYLRMYPFNKLKIDREFVRDMTSNAGDRALVFAAISMAHSLGLSVIAEGVERREQSDLLLRQGCETAQGFLYGRPVTVRELYAQLHQPRVRHG